MTVRGNPFTLSDNVVDPGEVALQPGDVVVVVAVALAVPALDVTTVKSATVTTAISVRETRWRSDRVTWLELVLFMAPLR
jgi:hypothetical protein